MVDDLKIRFMDELPAPEVGERTSTLKIGSAYVDLTWSDGEVTDVKAADYDLPMIHLERTGSSVDFPTGEIIKTCWTCYEDTETGAWICIQRRCPPVTLPE